MNWSHVSQHCIVSEIFIQITDISYSSGEGTNVHEHIHFHLVGTEPQFWQSSAKYNISPHAYNYIDILSHSTWKWTNAQPNHLLTVYRALLYTRPKTLKTGCRYLLTLHHLNSPDIESIWVQSSAFTENGYTVLDLWGFHLPVVVTWHSSKRKDVWLKMSNSTSVVLTVARNSQSGVEDYWPQTHGSIMVWKSLHIFCTLLRM